MRPTLLVNLLRSSHRADKVEQMSRALALVALMHLSSMPSEHPFMLDVASSPLTKLPCSPPRTIQRRGSANQNTSPGGEIVSRKDIYGKSGNQESGKPGIQNPRHGPLKCVHVNRHIPGPARRPPLPALVLSDSFPQFSYEVIAHTNDNQHHTTRRRKKLATLAMGHGPWRKIRIITYLPDI